MLMIIFGILLYFVGIDIEPFRYRMCNAPKFMHLYKFQQQQNSMKSLLFDLPTV